MSDEIVYSTGPGGPKKVDQNKNEKKKQKQKSSPRIKNDGIIRVQKESKGRGGKTVSVVYGLPLIETELQAIAKKLKQKCGTGGTVKDRTVIIQGDKVETILKLLKDEGYNVKRSGG